MSLFSGHELQLELDQRARQAVAYIDGLSTAQLVAISSTEAFAEDVVARFSLRAVTLDVEAAELSGDPVEVTLTVNDYGRATGVAHTMYRFLVPFEGSPEVLLCRPIAISTREPRQSGVRGDAVGIEVVVAVDATEPQIKNAFDDEVNVIQGFWLPSANEQVTTARSKLAEILRDRLAQRHALAAHASEVGRNLTFVKRRADAPELLPPVRRPVRIQDVGARPGSRQDVALPAVDPVLPDDFFEDLLRTLKSFGHALERSPRTFDNLAEEELRDFLLVILNATYEGTATGETFNAKGKTDLLLRHQDANAFIGECKIWSGEAKLHDALDQMLGDTTWRDTKASLIIFIKETNATSIIDRAANAASGHPCYISTRYDGRPDEIRFRYHHPDDSERLIDLALLPFVIRAGPVQRTRARKGSAGAIAE